MCEEIKLIRTKHTMLLCKAHKLETGRNIAGRTGHVKKRQQAFEQRSTWQLATKRTSKVLRVMSRCPCEASKHADFCAANTVALCFRNFLRHSADVFQVWFREARALLLPKKQVAADNLSYDERASADLGHDDRAASCGAARSCNCGSHACQ